MAETAVFSSNMRITPLLPVNYLKPSQLTCPANSIRVSDLRSSLTRLQCCAVLLEWWLKQAQL